MRSRARVWTAIAATSVPTTDEPDVGEQRARARGRAQSPAPAAGPSSRIANSGTATTSSATRKRKQRGGLREEQRRAVDGRQQEAVEPALVAVGDEQPPDPQQRGERQRHPQDAGGEVAVDRVAPQREVEEDVRRRAEQRHRDERLRRAALEPQLLGEHGARGGERARRGRGAHRYSAPICSAVTSAARASSAARPSRRPSARSPSASPPAGSWLVTTRVRPLARPTSGSSRSVRRRVEVRARLVEQQHVGVVQDGAADGEALRHAARERVHAVVAAAVEVDGRQQLLDPARPGGAARAGARGRRGSRAR